MTIPSHPSYSAMLDAILSDEYKRYLEPARITSKEPREDLPAFGDTSWKKPEIAFPIPPFASGTLLGGAAVMCVWLILGLSKDQPTVAEVRAPARAVESVESTSSQRTERLEVEMELVKKIVAGLAESVGELSSAERSVRLEASQPFSPTATSEDAMLPFPVQVITDKANLRSSPDLKAQTIAEVPKKTVLLAVDQQDKWLKVTTPKGQEAWVHRTVVSENNGG